MKSHTPLNRLYRFLTTVFLGGAALLLAACATTGTGETAPSVQQHFFSPSDGKYFGSSMTPSPEAAAEISRRAESGDSQALYESSLLLLNAQPKDETGRTGNETAAFETMKKAAEAGYVDAAVYLGTMYRLGQGVKKDRNEAIRWYNTAMAKGSAWGMFEMGSLRYERPDRDTQKTLDWFKKAAEAGYPMAQTAYGVFLLEGKDLPKDVVNGEKYMIKAAESGDAFSQFSLAIMYVRGMHFEKNLDIAEKWMKKSAEQNYLPAIQSFQWLSHMKDREKKKTDQGR